MKNVASPFSCILVGALLFLVAALAASRTALATDLRGGAGVSTTGGAGNAGDGSRELFYRGRGGSGVGSDGIRGDESDDEEDDYDDEYSDYDDLYEDGELEDDYDDAYDEDDDDDDDDDDYEDSELYDGYDDGYEDGELDDDCPKPNLRPCIKLYAPVVCGPEQCEYPNVCVAEATDVYVAADCTRTIPP